MSMWFTLEAIHDRIGQSQFALVENTVYTNFLTRRRTNRPITVINIAAVNTNYGKVSMQCALHSANTFTDRGSLDVDWICTRLIDPTWRVIN